MAAVSTAVTARAFAAASQRAFTKRDDTGSVPVIRARPDRRRSVVAAATLPGRNPDGSYGHPRPADSTVPHAISEPAALTDEEVDAVIAMEKWAKAEEGMRLVQELESHSAQRDDAIADLQNMLNGIGKAPTDTEAAALAAQPVAPTEFIPPQTPVDHAANNIVPEVPVPAPVPWKSQPQSKRCTKRTPFSTNRRASKMLLAKLPAPGLAP